MPQLSCVGGSGRGGGHQPRVVQCYNRGWDGQAVQWECKADLNTKVRFGKVEVSCEGYYHKEDENILVGSCGLQYELESTEPPLDWIVFMIIIAIIIVIILIGICSKKHSTKSCNSCSCYGCWGPWGPLGHWETLEETFSIASGFGGSSPR